MNGAFNEKDYPAAAEIRSKFALDMKVLPFPDADDFRSDLDDDTVADIKREIGETAGKVVDDAMKATADQIVELVGHMAAKLHEYKTNKQELRKNDAAREAVAKSADEIVAEVSKFLG
jgi:hypothetical protein